MHFISRAPGVHLLQEMPQDDLHAAMKRCFAVVNSSISEGDVCCNSGGNCILAVRFFSEVTLNLKSPFITGNVCQHFMSMFQS